MAGIIAEILIANLIVLGLLILIMWIYIMLIRYRRKKALRGDYGEESMWFAEFVEEEDEKVINSAKSLSKDDFIEVCVVADSKERLRELIIERAEQNSRNSKPEDLLR